MIAAQAGTDPLASLFTHGMTLQRCPDLGAGRLGDGMTLLRRRHLPHRFFDCLAPGLRLAQVLARRFWQLPTTHEIANGQWQTSFLEQTVGVIVVGLLRKRAVDLPLIDALG